MKRDSWIAVSTLVIILAWILLLYWLAGGHW